MSKRVQFIWDYFGAPAARTAEHHKIHLQEFVEARQLQNAVTAWQQINDKKAIAFITLEEVDAKELKDILRPHRAHWVD